MPMTRPRITGEAPKPTRTIRHLNRSEEKRPSRASTIAGGDRPSMLGDWFERIVGLAEFEEGVKRRQRHGPGKGKRGVVMREPHPDPSFVQMRRGHRGCG